MSVRQTFDQVRDGAVVLAEYAVETVYAAGHPEWRRSGATAEEESRELVGDDLVPAPNWSVTRAETVRAAPEEVWPWLAQMGYGRGGWYSDFPWWKDPAGHRGRRSAAERVLPEHQHLRPGEVLLDGPNCSAEVGSWWVRDVVPAAEGVRLLVRTRVRYHPGWVVRLAVVLRAGDTVMQRAMLLGIRRRAEATRSAAAR
ncbi:hypothetical protein [Georgenia sp. SUBG003]|uniref:hypothetical protein n=1 Tax=Georgenia sp. SUBG003 TaxID=1497974 RepID=UPI000693468D